MFCGIQCGECSVKETLRFLAAGLVVPQQISQKGTQQIFSPNFLNHN